jgi:predicted nucleic-acid-binding Zn-ribbon protein
MMWLKACPRCRGDLYPEEDLSGAYLQCLQCGYTLYEPERLQATRRAGPLGARVRRTAKAAA